MYMYIYKIHQLNTIKIIKKPYREKLVKDIKVILKKKKKRSNSIVVNDTEIYLKMENESLLSIEKILQNDKKRLDIIIKTIFI